jgi:hypothetical protein
MASTIAPTGSQASSAHDQVGQRQRDDALAGRAAPARRPLEQADPLEAVARGQRHQQILLAGEVPVQGARGVLALLGDARHLQVEQAVALDQRLRAIEDPGLAQGELALLACSGVQGGGSGGAAARAGSWAGVDCEPDSFHDPVSRTAIAVADALTCGSGADRAPLVYCPVQ